MIDTIGLFAVSLTVLVSLGLCNAVVIFFLFRAFKWSVSKYVEAKSSIWVVRRWSQQEKEIARLNAVIIELTKQKPN